MEKGEILCGHIGVSTLFDPILKKKKLCLIRKSQFVNIFADLFEPCLVPTCLARDTEPCARSISWSQQGFAPNYG
jgi:hypothetical protein